MIKGLELDLDVFITIESQITELLKQEKDFTSKRYSGLDIPTINGKWILIEPKNEWLKIIEPLGIVFNELDESIILK